MKGDGLPKYLEYTIYCGGHSGLGSDRWDQVETEADISVAIAEMRAAFRPDEPARVFGVERGTSREIWLLTDDPSNLLTPEAKQERSYQFSQQKTGQRLPNGADIEVGRCEQCGTRDPVVVTLVDGSIPGVVLPGNGRSEKAVCAECLADIAAGQNAFPTIAVSVSAEGGWRRVRWTGREVAF
ncbi:hypothetical protein D3877_29120 [Azospirillum cavernae]|uniref:Uncharacterized protein n=2 Tax=Azospirillum cavernae TaxID=2320860 RepID=A0A418VJX1_9PROT|nr:hypothetical protein D3877_29120 [Azospirillum cavernae]